MTERQAAYHRQRSICRMAALLTSLSAPVHLLSLYYAPGPAVPNVIVDCQYRTLMDRARRLAGGPFRYVKATEYGAGPPSPGIVLRLFLELPAEVCQELARHWFMGNATMEQLDTQQIAQFAADLMAHPVCQKEKRRRPWTTSLGLAR